MHAIPSFFIILIVIFSIPYFIWRFGITDALAPLPIVQIITGILLGPGMLGAVFPGQYSFFLTHDVIQSMNGISWWAATLFIFFAGTELNLKEFWVAKRDSLVTASFALLVPLAFGCMVGLGMVLFSGWVGERGANWQLVLAIGMSCAVTALPFLVLLIEKLGFQGKTIGQRLLRYASLDDITLWCVLAVILIDVDRLERQLVFLCAFSLLAYVYRRTMTALQEADRWQVCFIWLASCSFTAEMAGFDYTLGAFLAGVATERNWFNEALIGKLQQFTLLLLMPVYFLSTGLLVDWNIGSVEILILAFILLFVSIAGKLVGVHIAARILKWPPGEAFVISWMLQTKGFVLIIFSNILLKAEIISRETFISLLIMGIASTLLTMTMVGRKIEVFAEQRI